MTDPIRIVIVGGGVARLILATRLGRSHGRSGRASVTLVDRSLSHVWKPMLHTFAAGTARPDRQQVNFLAQAKANGFSFFAADLDGIDRDAKVAVVRPLGRREPDRGPLPPLRVGYDRLVLALGSRANDFGTPGVSDHCIAIDDLASAQTIHARLRHHALAALHHEDELGLAIVGGGATGVELAAELKRAANLLAAYGSPNLPHRFRLTLIESGPRLLAAFPDHIAQAASDTLRDLGVDVRTGAMVTGADADGFILKDGSRIEARIKVWAAGVRAPDVLARLEGLERSRIGQLVVDEGLRITHDLAILALGDCAGLVDRRTGKPVPATAQAATQQAHYLARHVEAWCSDGPVPPFRYRDRGAIVSLADYNGWGTLGRYTFGGGRLQGLFARLGHALLYRQHQLSLLGPVRGPLTWFVDSLDHLVSPPVRLD